MKVQGTDLSMIRGDSETITVSCADINNQPIVFQTGDIIYFTVKAKATDTEKLIQKLVTTFVDGTALIELVPSNTSSLRFKTYVYDIQWKRANGTVTTIVPPSNFIVLEEVTYE